MLTYSGFKDMPQWLRFLTAVNEEQLKAWGVKHWCATLESCTRTSGALHVHVFLQFHKAAERSSRAFAFEGIAPRVDQNDLGGEGLCRKKLQESMNRGFFYVFANKIGNVLDETGAPCVAGNYMPCWTAAALVYPVLAKGQRNSGKSASSATASMRTTSSSPATASSRGRRTWTR
eukprot:5107695-Heterocapsa_arctica.AAC.2